MTQLATEIFSTVHGFGDFFGAAGRHRSLLRRILFPGKVACVTIMGFMMSAGPALSEDLPVCQDPKNAVSISQTNLTPSAVDVHMEQDQTGSKAAVGVLHFYLRSEGATEPHKICATAHFADTRGEPRTVAVTVGTETNVRSPNGDQNPSCVEFASPWKTFQEIPFDLHMSVDSTFIPLSGSVSLSSSGTSKEPSVPDPATRKGNLQRQVNGDGEPPITTHSCTTSSKVLTRSVMLLPSIRPSSLKFPLIGTFGTAIAYFLLSLVFLWNKRGQPMGGPQWNFSTSFATNFTVGTGLLTPLLGAGVLTDALHYMTKFHYVVLGILFAALLLLGPALFSFFSTKRQITTESGQASTASVGTVGLFLATSALMIGAAVGQLVTVGFAIAEVEFSGYIGCATMMAILVLLAVAGAGTVACAIITIRTFLKQDSEQARQSIDQLRSIGHKVAGLRSGVERYSAASELFTDQDGKAIDRAIERHQPELHTWNMF
jgi:hypothetical protein